MANRAIHQRNAFTLLELILVLAIVATMLAIVASSLRSFHAQRIAADAAGHFLMVCKQARTHAIQNAVTYHVHLDLASRTYWLSSQQPGGSQRLATEVGRTFELPEDVSIYWQQQDNATQEATIAFLPDGRVQAAQVVFVSRQGDAVAVYCTAADQTLRIGTPEEDAVESMAEPSRY